MVATQVRRLLACAKWTAVALMLAVGRIEAATAQQAQAADLTITDVRVFTGERVIEKAAVSVRGGKIVGISPAAPAGAITIDGTGMTALPGLIDAHTHLLWVGSMQESEVLAFMKGGLRDTLKAYLRHGVTTVVSLADPTDPIVQVRRELAEGVLEGPRLLVAGPAFTAKGGHPAVTFCRGSEWCRATVAAEADAEEEARRQLRYLADLDVDVVKVVNQGGMFLGKIPLAKIKPEVLRAIVAESRSRQLPVLAHVWHEADAAEAVAAGASLSHLPNGPLSSDALASVLQNQGRYVVTTFATRKRQGATAATLMQLHKAGVQLVMGSDAGPSPPGLAEERPPGQTTIREIKALVEGGLDPLEALKSSTAVPARMLGLQDQVGRLEPGMSADVLLVRGNPVQNISDLEQVIAVIQAGKVVFRAPH